MEIDKEIIYLATTDEPYSKQSAMLDYKKDNLKNVKGCWITARATEVPKMSMALLTEEYYSTGAYYSAIKEIQELNTIVSTLKNKRATSILKIDVWRTLEASRRKGNIS